MTESESPTDWLTEVKLCGNCIKFVPENLITREMCFAAVYNDPWAIEVVPYRWKSSDLYLYAVQQDGRVLEFVPDSMKKMWQSICYDAVQQNGNALEFVPDSMKTPRVCLAAVTENKCALEYVPERLQTDELIQVANSLKSYL